MTITQWKAGAPKYRTSPNLYSYKGWHYFVNILHIQNQCAIRLWGSGKICWLSTRVSPIIHSYRASRKEASHNYWQTILHLTWIPHCSDYSVPTQLIIWRTYSCSILHFWKVLSGIKSPKSQLHHILPRLLETSAAALGVPKANTNCTIQN